MPAPLTIITNAHLKLRLLAHNQQLPPEDLEVGLVDFNLMLDDWATRRRFVWYVRNQAFPFAVSQQSYTFGPSGDFIPTNPTVGKRPQRIERAKLVMTSGSPDTEMELPVINTDQYADLSMPLLTSTLPGRIYYSPTLPNGTIFPYPYPTDTANQLRLYWWHRLEQVLLADVGTSIDLPDGYENALTLTLMESLCETYGKEISPRLERFARNARANIQSLNPLSEPPREPLAQGPGMAAFRSRNF